MNKSSKIIPDFLKYYESRILSLIADGGYITPAVATKMLLAEFDE